MSDRGRQAAVFAALHVKGDPIILYNAWDAGSAQVIARAGAKAIATGSWSVAAAHGYLDGEEIPLDLALANLARIAGAVDLPVSLDLEAGYGATPDAVRETVTQVLQAGAIGFNLEDRSKRTTLYSESDAAARVRAARAAARSSGVDAFVNARTDLFLITDRARHDAALLDAALRRANLFAEAGASGFFAPGLVDETLIGLLCERSPLPVNILALAGAPPAARLAALGVARVSYGPGPYRVAMQAVEDGARRAFAWRS